MPRPDWMPDFITPQLIVSLVVIVVVIHIMLGAAAYLILLERKICAWVQDRIGPTRLGPQRSWVQAQIFRSSRIR